MLPYLVEEAPFQVTMDSGRKLSFTQFREKTEQLPVLPVNPSFKVAKADLLQMKYALNQEDLELF